MSIIEKLSKFVLTIIFVPVFPFLILLELFIWTFYGDDCFDFLKIAIKNLTFGFLFGDL